MDDLEPRTFCDIRHRSLTHMTCPDIYRHIIYLRIDARYHQSVRILSAITVRTMII